MVDPVLDQSSIQAAPVIVDAEEGQGELVDALLPSADPACNVIVPNHVAESALEASSDDDQDVAASENWLDDLAADVLQAWLG